jgi:phosphoribosylaminoimidazole (AIR) synthetase
MSNSDQLLTELEKYVQRILQVHDQKEPFTQAQKVTEGGGNLVAALTRLIDERIEARVKQELRRQGLPVR